jgi:hypothetical protein
LFSDRRSCLSVLQARLSFSNRLDTSDSRLKAFEESDDDIKKEKERKKERKREREKENMKTEREREYEGGLQNKTKKDQ